MRPVLFHLGGWDISTHAFFVGLGIAVAVAVFFRERARVGNCGRRRSSPSWEHPSFLYEIAFHLAAFAALVWLKPRVQVPGELFVLGWAGSPARTTGWTSSCSAAASPPCIRSCPG